MKAAQIIFMMVLIFQKQIGIKLDQELHMDMLALPLVVQLIPLVYIT